MDEIHSKLLEQIKQEFIKNYYGDDEGKDIQSFKVKTGFQLITLGNF